MTGTKAVGLRSRAVGVCSIIVQGGLVGAGRPALGERRAVLVGLLFGAAGFASSVAPTGAKSARASCCLALWGLPTRRCRA